MCRDATIRLFYTGERLFSLIHDTCASLTAKITGMLLEMDNLELLFLLESPESLHAKAGGGWEAAQQRARAGLDRLWQPTSICCVLVGGSQLRSLHRQALGSSLVKLQHKQLCSDCTVTSSPGTSIGEGGSGGWDLVSGRG